MKKLIVIIVFVVKWHILFSQENNLVVFFVDAITNGVPVYSNDTCTNSISIVKEYPEKENWDRSGDGSLICYKTLKVFEVC